MGGKQYAKYVVYILNAAHLDLLQLHMHFISIYYILRDLLIFNFTVHALTFFKELSESHIIFYFYHSRSI